jgi:ATP-binding cassette subfamily F protein uup
LEQRAKSRKVEGRKVGKSGVEGQKVESQKIKNQKSRKLSNKERAELEHLPKLIEQLEAEQEELHQAMADPAFYQKTKEEIAAATARAEEIPNLLEEAFERWEKLENNE